MAARERLLDAALDLAWSHWTALGVRGTARIPDTAVDPEALVYFTASLARHDPRLLQEAADWWRRYPRHVSRTRVARLARSFEKEVVDAFLDFDARATRSSATSGRSSLEHLDLPAHALLRFRCVFGVNARAEVLLALLTQWSDVSDGVTASMLAEVGYGKRNIALVLDDLRLGGLVVGSSETNRVRYRLANAAALRGALGALPFSAGRWHLKLPILAAFVSLTDRIHGKDAVVQAIEASKTLKRLAPLLATLHLEVPKLAASDTYWAALQAWLVENLLAEVSDPARRVPRMLEGVWIGPRGTLSRPDRFFSAVLPELSADPAHDDRLACLDLVEVTSAHHSKAWEYRVLSEAAMHTYEHSAGLSLGQEWHFATWELGAVQVFRAELGQAMPPEQLARRYGVAAAARARKDRPAVQLMLRRVDPEQLPR